jgi:Prokaryotic Cytochrome C oxidase subunit IV
VRSLFTAMSNCKGYDRLAHPRRCDSMSWWLGTDHGMHADLNRFQTTAGLMVLAFIKVRLIMPYFMEVRTAPWPLRLICDVYA